MTSVILTGGASGALHLTISPSLHQVSPRPLGWVPAGSRPKMAQSEEVRLHLSSVSSEERKRTEKRGLIKGIKERKKIEKESK